MFHTYICLTIVENGLLTRNVPNVVAIDHISICHRMDKDGNFIRYSDDTSSIRSSCSITIWTYTGAPIFNEVIKTILTEM